MAIIALLIMKFITDQTFKAREKKMIDPSSSEEDSDEEHGTGHHVGHHPPSHHPHHQTHQHPV